MEDEFEDILTAHPLPTFNKTAESKIIETFARRAVKDEFYSNRKLVTGKKASSLKNLKGLLQRSWRGPQQEDLRYISESLTPRRKKLFGSTNKIKKDLCWKFIWTNPRRIYLKQGEHSPRYKFDSTDNLEKFKKNMLKSNPRGKYLEEG